METMQGQNLIGGRIMDQRVAAAAAGCSEAQRDVTPVEGALQNLQRALVELEHVANSLIDPLITVIQYDPRDSVKAAADEAASEKSDPNFSCKLHGVLAQRTADVLRTTKRLLEIRSAIRL